MRKACAVLPGSAAEGAAGPGQECEWGREQGGRDFEERIIPRAGEAGALILRAEEPGAGDAAGILGSGLDLQRPSYIGEDWDGSLQS